ncbi:MAG TPA: SOS response-associated peptidase [Gemmataceae bacterium]|nr:SOS response-associated peptidase [Gemmataceae bacterium]
MCGRFTLFASGDELARLFGFETAGVPALEPRYNVAPTQPVAAVRLDDGRRALVLLRWGLIPSWAKDPGIGNSLINARSETAAEKPSFRSAFRQRRCLVPASGFYEWQATGGKHKQPYHFRRRDGKPFAFAGLWERWHDGDGQPVETCAILTTEANAVVRPVHDRMPVILPPGDFAAWLDPRTPGAEVGALLRPYPAEEMTGVPVGRYVSNPRNEGPQCLTP